MANHNKSSSRFLRKVWNQVLRTNNQRIDYSLNFYDFDTIDNPNYTFLNNFYMERYKNTDITDVLVEFWGPRDYPWEDKTECYFFIPKYKVVIFDIEDTIFVLPHAWLRQYDPTIPIYISSYYYTWCYLDFENQNCYHSTAYLMRERFFLHGKRPVSIRKGDEDWCITHLNIDHSLYRSEYSYELYSFLLIKNIDFSDFDVLFEVGRLKCPAKYNKSVKLKDKSQSQFKIGIFSLAREDLPCICAHCRKDCRAIEVSVTIGKNVATLYLYGPTK